MTTPTKPKRPTRPAAKPGTISGQAAGNAKPTATKPATGAKPAGKPKPPTGTKPAKPQAKPAAPAPEAEEVNPNAISTEDWAAMSTEDKIAITAEQRGALTAEQKAEWKEHRKQAAFAKLKEKAALKRAARVKARQAQMSTLQGEITVGQQLYSTRASYYGCLVEVVEVLEVRGRNLVKVKVLTTKKGQALAEGVEKIRQMDPKFLQEEPPSEAYVPRRPTAQVTAEPETEDGEEEAEVEEFEDELEGDDEEEEAEEEDAEEGATDEAEDLEEEDGEDEDADEDAEDEDSWG